MPKVSVIMGVYNTLKKEYLEKSINSILKQTYSDFEFIICDDGSTNNCLDWAKEICNGDVRCIFISNDENKGLAYTLNHCLSISKGEYIARMDDDDEALPDRFTKQVEFLDNNKEYDVVQCNANIFNDDGIYGQLKYKEIIEKEDFLFNNPIIHPAVMIRKSAYDLVDNYRDDEMTVRVEDYDLFLRMYAKGIKMYTIQKNLFMYRRDQNSANKKKFKYRINEMKVRYYGFKELSLFPKAVPYVIKPIIVGFIPHKMLANIKKKEANSEEK